MISWFLFKYVAAACNSSDGFFGLPTWYKYLPQNPNPDSLGNCQFQIDYRNLNTYWLIALALAEILLRVAAIVAIGFVVWGGVQYITSQGEPDRTQKAKNTIINALIGLVVSVAAATLVSFVGRKFK